MSAAGPPAGPSTPPAGLARPWDRAPSVPVGRVAQSVGWSLVAYWLLERLFPAPFGVLIQGLIIGALTAMVAFGIGLIYRSSRVINFAQADLGVVPAALAVTLMTRTRLVGFRQIPAGISYWLAVPLALVCAVVLGTVVERAIIRRFSRAPRLILMVVTIGLSQILAGVGTAIPVMLGETLPPETYPSPFGFSFSIGSVVFRGNDLLAVVVTCLAIAGLFGFLRFTHVGTAIRACAESADRAALLGINVGRTQNVVWVLAALLSTVAMILRAGIIGLPIGSAVGPTILLRALAAAVIGRMENFGVMFAAAAGLGVIETSIVYAKGSATLVDPVLFIIVIVTLLLQRRRRESRVEDQATSSWEETARVRPVPRELVRLPEVVWGGRAALALVGLAAVAFPLVLSDARANLAAAILIYAVIGVSLVILTGWSGDVSLGQMAFVAVGAAVSGSLNVYFHWDLTLTVLAAAGAGALASVVIGLPALRVRGLFLAVSTLAFANATSSFLLNRSYLHFLPDNVTQRVTRFPLLGRLDISGEKAFYYVCLGLLVVALWAARGLQRARMARVTIAARDNPRAAQAFGISLTRTKLVAFAASGFFASMAGGLFAIHQQAVGQEVFSPIASIQALSMVVVGGLGSLPGAIVGAVFVKGLEWFDTAVPVGYRALFTFVGSGAGLLVVLWFLPGGLGSLLYRARDRYLRAVAGRRGITVPSLVADSDPDRAAPTRRGRGRSARWARGAGALLGRDRDHTVPPLRAAHPESLVSVSDLDVSYGAVQILFGIELEVRRGEILALLGTNGAGKSTVLRALSGLVPTAAGSIWFDGTNITGRAPHRVAASGMIQVPGGRGVFPSLSVGENLRVAGWMYRREPAYITAAQGEVLAMFPVLSAKLADPAASLSGGQQQMLALAMAFIARPRLLMIDELSLGLAPVIVDQLLGVVRRLQERGVTIVLVEQSVSVALTVAQRAYFLEKGEVRFEGPTVDLLDRPDILRSVFLQGAASNGKPAADRKRAKARGSVAVAAGAGSRPSTAGTAASAAPILELDELSKAFTGVPAVDDVSLRLQPGEILGIIGPNGAGKTTLFDLISGFLAPDQGRILYDGTDVTTLSPDARSRLGMGRSFQDARLFGSLTVHQAICVALDRTLQLTDPVAAALNLPSVTDAETKLAGRADELIELMGIAAFRDKFVAELSTGSRRVVDLACLVGLEPRVILFDEPSSGIAQRETEALGPLLRSIRERTGAALLQIEHDMPLITSVADRLMALDLGQVVVQGSAAEVTAHERVVASYLGATRETIRRSGPSGARPRRSKPAPVPAAAGEAG